MIKCVRSWLYFYMLSTIRYDVNNSYGFCFYFVALRYFCCCCCCVCAHIFALFGQECGFFRIGFFFFHFKNIKETTIFLTEVCIWHFQRLLELLRPKTRLPYGKISIYMKTIHFIYCSKFVFIKCHAVQTWLAKMKLEFSKNIYKYYHYSVYLKWMTVCYFFVWMKKVNFLPNWTGCNQIFALAIAS